MRIIGLICGSYAPRVLHFSAFHSDLIERADGVKLVTPEQCVAVEENTRD